MFKDVHLLLHVARGCGMLFPSKKACPFDSYSLTAAAGTQYEHP